MSAAVEASQRDQTAAAPLVPGTKAARHASIVQILSRERIRSQAQLRKSLAQRGISTTQATLSRDLVELRATKIRAPGGELIYAMPEAGAPGQVHAGTLSETEETDDSLRAHTTPRLSRWCAELLVTAEWAGPQVVLRTPAGAAQLLAGAVDDAMMPGVMGCVAGDDTVLVITRDAQVAADVARHLLALADPSARA
ncbi:ArgR family transcriptional regulator [Actinomyces oris]|uniref:ArgR family transcriptional regulator n=1 Tax=Actinomyces oris TaxID=544580 RepID=UPI00094E5AA1|nr:ArgR family transcriptional regulator [Actinomyces oris]OLO55477.1 ArgR family transcriptional regulator [Actinomyces oris]